jgi:hypothetical protein
MKKVVRLTESDLVRLVKKVLMEQPPITLPRVLPRFDVAKGIKSTPRQGFRQPQDADTPNDTECFEVNVKKIFNYCNSKKSQFTPDDESKKIAKKLYDEMDGLNFTNTGLFNTLKSIKDYKQFCKVNNSFYYDSENLEKWINDEWVHPKDVSDSLQHIWKGIGHTDSCNSYEYTGTI